MSGARTLPVLQLYNIIITSQRDLSTFDMAGSSSQSVASFYAVECNYPSEMKTHKNKTLLQSIDAAEMHLSCAISTNGHLSKTATSVISHFPKILKCYSATQTSLPATVPWYSEGGCPIEGTQYNWVWKMYTKI